MKPTLYFAPGSSSMAPHIALHEIGEPFEARPVSFAANEQRSSAFLSMNAEGKVPVLLHGSLVLTEVAAILYYLARRYPHSGLWPDQDLETQARIVSWMSFCASTIHPARRQGPERALEVMQLANDRLGNRPWVAGDYSIADIHLFRLYWRLRPGMGSETKRFEALESLYQRMMDRPAVQRTIETESSAGYTLPR